jgi:electron transfer flavoprotein alpha subunit
MSGEELAASTLAALGAAARLARGVDLPLDVVLPVTSRAARNRGIARLVAGAAPRRIYALEHPRLDRFGWKGHLEWFQELWGMYRGEARWLLGPEWAGTMFARFAGEGPPGVDRAWPWLHVGAIENGDGPLRLGSSIFDGAGWAFAAPPAEGLRIVTLTPEAEVRLAAATEGAASEAATETAATETAATEVPATEVFAYEPRLDYDPDADPVAALLARLGGGEPTLRDADYVVDFGYGAGGREGLETLAEPLLAVLVDELGLADAMIGGTRKVTQDLEVLPMDRQIGQTGVRVSPKVLVALGVSGAPQHVDWIGDHTVILAFNIDPEAPLMKLNEQRPTPVVHPIVGDVKETVPRFIAALRAAAAAGE